MWGWRRRALARTSKQIKSKANRIRSSAFSEVPAGGHVPWCVGEEMPYVRCRGNGSLAYLRRPGGRSRV